jgi:hypothetical protein
MRKEAILDHFNNPKSTLNGQEYSEYFMLVVQIRIFDLQNIKQQRQLLNRDFQLIKLML